MGGEMRDLYDRFMREERETRLCREYVLPILEKTEDGTGYLFDAEKAGIPNLEAAIILAIEAARQTNGPIWFTWGSDGCQCTFEAHANSDHLKLFEAYKDASSRQDFDPVIGPCRPERPTSTDSVFEINEGGEISLRGIEIPSDDGEDGDPAA